MIDTQDKPPKPKVFCEFVGSFPFDNSKDSKPRFDFYQESGMIASCFDIYIAAMVKAELVCLGYDVVDFPDMGYDKRVFK